VWRFGYEYVNVGDDGSVHRAAAAWRSGGSPTLPDLEAGPIERDAAAAERVGVVGLGWIGAGAARRLKLHGHTRIPGYDLDEKSLVRAADAVVACPTPAAVGQEADVVLVAVFDDAQVREAIGGPDGILSAADLPEVVVVLSTVTVDTVAWASDCARAKGVELLDCGVTGGLSIGEGTVTLVVGGPDAVVARVTPVLEAFGSVVHVGPAGAGMAAKLAKNLITFARLLAAWEGARLVSAAGGDVTSFARAVESSIVYSPPMMHLVERGVGAGLANANADVTEGPELLRYALKDIPAALELGRSLGLDLPLAQLTYDLFDQVTTNEARDG
jgi:3-hydroxyisobutyrate dehydrogenase